MKNLAQNHTNTEHLACAFEERPRICLPPRDVRVVQSAHAHPRIIWKFVQHWNHVLKDNSTLNYSFRMENRNFVLKCTEFASNCVSRHYIEDCLS